MGVAENCIREIKVPPKKLLLSFTEQYPQSVALTQLHNVLLLFYISVVFDELIKQLKKLDGMKMSIPVEIHADEDGYIDRQCPNADCLYDFKILETDLLSDLVRDEKMWCPSCGHTAEADAWFSEEQANNLQERAYAEVGNLINKAMVDDAKKWNRKQKRNQFLSISVKVKRQNKTIVLPAKPNDAMQLRIKCDFCSCNYAVIGSTHFCPACGETSAKQIFEQSAQTIRVIIERIEEICAVTKDLDDQKNLNRAFVEDALKKCVTIFQVFVESIIDGQKSAPNYRSNLFQNLSAGSDYFSENFGSGYSDFIGEDNIHALNVLFQKRHLLTHNDGIVDQRYLDKSSDSSIKTGQRIVVKNSDVSECLLLVEKLGEKIEAIFL